MFTKALVLATVSSVAFSACKRGYFKYADELDAEEFNTWEIGACAGYMTDDRAYSSVLECGKDPDNADDDNKYVWLKSYNSYECKGSLNQTYRFGVIGDLDDADWVAQMEATYGYYVALFDETQTSCGGDKCWVKYEIGRSAGNLSSCENTAYYYKGWQPIGECYYGEQYTCTSSSFTYANCTGNTAVTVVDEGCFEVNDEESITVDILYCGAYARSVIAAAFAVLFTWAFSN
jgi:hypothetical protein